MSMPDDDFIKQYILSENIVVIDDSSVYLSTIANFSSITTDYIEIQWQTLIGQLGYWKHSSLSLLQHVSAVYCYHQVNHTKITKETAKVRH